MKKLNKKGFTIVELVIVIAVIAILAAVLIPTFSGVAEKANQSAALQNCRNEYTQAKVAIAVNGSDLKDGTVFESNGFYFEYANGEFKAKENYEPVASKATALANGVTVYQDFGTTLDASKKSDGWAEKPDGVNCPSIKINSNSGNTTTTTVTNFKVYNDSNVVVESAASVNCPNGYGVYFTRPAEGYYYVTYSIDEVNYAGIIYIPALD